MILKYSDLGRIASFATCRILPDRFSLFWEIKNTGFCRIATGSFHNKLILNTNYNQVIAG